MTSEKELTKRASQSTKLLREKALSLPPEQPERDVREGIAASTELGILIFSKLGEIQLKQAEQNAMLSRMWEESSRFSSVLIEGHRSKIELDEEITRADLDLRKLKLRRSERIWMRVLAGLLAPAALVQFWEWMKMLVQ